MLHWATGMGEVYPVKNRLRKLEPGIIQDNKKLPSDQI